MQKRDSDTGLFVYRSVIPGAAEEVFAWHERPEALRALTPFRGIRIHGSGGIRDGARVVLSAGVGPLRVRWEARHYGYIPGWQFCDEQVRGPFRTWRHVHRVYAMGPDHALYEDRVEYAIRGGAFARRIADPLLRRAFDRLFAWRHAVVRSSFAARQEAA